MTLIGPNGSGEIYDFKKYYQHYAHWKWVTISEKNLKDLSYKELAAEDGSGADTGK